jgi:hypothetical protein
MRPGFEQSSSTSSYLRGHFIETRSNGFLARIRSIDTIEIGLIERRTNERKLFRQKSLVYRFVFIEKKFQFARERLVHDQTHEIEPIRIDHGHFRQCLSISGFDNEEEEEEECHCKKELLVSLQVEPHESQLIGIVARRAILFLFAFIRRWNE